MGYDIRKKIDYHGKMYLRDGAFSISRLIIVCIVVAFLFKGKIDMLTAILLALYSAVTILTTRKKMAGEKKYSVFSTGNPAFDYLSQFGNPENVLDKINEQINSGKTSYEEFTKKNSSSPETVITDEYFLHINRQPLIIPLSEIICVYLYDNVTKESPPENFLATHFKPIYLIITYSKGREAIIRHSSCKYKSVIEALDKKLGCRITYTRDLGRLFNTDYEAFLTEVRALTQTHDEIK